MNYRKFGGYSQVDRDLIYSYKLICQIISELAEIKQDYVFGDVFVFGDTNYNHIPIVQGVS